MNFLEFLRPFFIWAMILAEPRLSSHEAERSSNICACVFEERMLEDFPKFILEASSGLASTLAASRIFRFFQEADRSLLGRQRLLGHFGLFFPPLWQRGVRGDFINRKQFQIPSITPPIFSKTSLSENLMTLIPIFLRTSSLILSFSWPGPE